MNIRIDDVAVLTEQSERRKKELRHALETTHPRFAGTDNRRYTGIIDAYHGETGLPLDANAQAALERAWGEILHKTTPADYTDDILYDKRQPLVLRRLAAEKLFENIAAPAHKQPGPTITADDVIVAPYSSTVLLEEALASIATTDGVIICPEGFYKNASIHIKKLGLRIITSPNRADNSFKLDIPAFARCIQQTRESHKVCGILLTLPGNPAIANYSIDELIAIGRILIESELPIICDMAFDRVLDQHTPLASLTIDGVRLYDRIVTITGNSKGYNAFGPCKFGAACTGNAEWRERIRRRLTTSFQRETTHLARATLEHTSADYFVHNRQIMHRQQGRAADHIARINQRFGKAILQPLGAAQGMFLTLTFDEPLLQAAGITTSAQLEEALLEHAGIDSVALDRTGSPRIGVRLNILAPRKTVGQETPDLLDELFDRLEQFLYASTHSTY
jgi:aspartate/methionine/tyrosine aminotransferase